MRQIAQLFADGGAAVRALSTTATEGEVNIPFETQLATLGASPVTRSSVGNAALWTAQLRGITYECLEIDHARRFQWERHVGAAYDQRLAEIVRDFRPQLTLTFGGDPGDARRRKMLRTHGTRVVFALHNLAYLAHTLTDVDEFLAPTEFLAQRYRNAWGRAITVLPPPIDETTVRAPTVVPVCLCFVNPEPAKGAALVARIAQRLGHERPDVPLLVFGGRAPGTALEDVARQLGFSLAEFPNLLLSPPTLSVAELWSTCRVLLAPSVVEEAAGRVAVEAMLNGAVPIVSDRGGLPEMVGSAGVVIAMPSELNLRTPLVVSEAIVDAWWSALVKLIDDQSYFTAMSQTARERGEKFTCAALAKPYTDWLESIIATPPQTVDGDRALNRR